MAVTVTDVQKIANLARLQIDENEMPEFVAQFNDILAHMDVLQQANTSNVSADLSGTTCMPLRDDTVAPAPMRFSAEGMTADSRDGFILVPRLSTHEDV
jgi:aspartyl-tRNA(Asn)/glutamyl-tRNA(Gln) amidotransferase subunit C